MAEAAMAEGVLLSYEEFAAQADQLAAMSRELGDSWELRHVRVTDGPEETVYLAKFSSLMSPEVGGYPGGPTDPGEPGDIQDDDPAELQSLPRPPAVYFEYHVIYSPTYQVPMLFFTATDHSGKLVPLRDIWKFVSPFHITKGAGLEWESVTQQEHPLLCRPFYHIHPCHTSVVMATALSDKHRTGHGNETLFCRTSYLLSWLTIFGPTIGLNMSLNYLKMSIQQ